jgi:hypothetical protein
MPPDTGTRIGRGTTVITGTTGTTGTTGGTMVTAVMAVTAVTMVMVGTTVTAVTAVIKRQSPIKGSIGIQHECQVGSPGRSRGFPLVFLGSS